MRCTHTYAILAVSPATFADVQARVNRINGNGDYNDMFGKHDGKPTILMQGIAIKAQTDMDPERERAFTLAEKVLDRPNADPDDDLAVLARQLLRSNGKL